MAKRTMEYKVYFHLLIPSIDGLQCYGSNLPDHPEGSCLNPKHPLVYPNLKLTREKRERVLYD